MTHKPLAVDLASMSWRKSSRSNGTGNCVEVGWRKSSYSGQSGSCVEVGQVVDLVGMRDSKLGDASPVLTVSRARWADFVAAVKVRGFQWS
ncbi:DUF397 domain-containing protein [Saccharopolyspora pogona]|uniref:DUF397 domain-containing protein n=1 Tax=Saccharopolyspora pogona TaxID=333966 RepID=UPI00168369CA|nr:DUF397 domain-containing protein [Saccharopolyspora pogona]